MDLPGLKKMIADLSVEKDALHVYLAFSVQILAAALLRRPLSSWRPWFAVLAAELINEACDIWLGEEAHVQQWQIDGSRHDILNTMVLPTVLLVLCRFAPGLFASRRSPAAAPPIPPPPADG